MLKRMLLALLVCSSTSYADDTTLSIDRAVSGGVELAFPNEQNMQPEQSDFEVKNFVLMSNDIGERWAVVTLTNQASGRRTLTHKHLMAIVADGQRVIPIEFMQSFKANETLSVTITFGASKFPLLSIYSRSGA